MSKKTTNHPIDFTFSQKFEIRTQYQRKDGYCPIYLRIIINRVTKRYATNVNWLPHLFDNTSDKPIQLRSTRDKEAIENNIILSDIWQRANQIYKSYRLDQKFLSAEIFDKEFKNRLSRQDLISYWEYKMNDIFERGIIDKLTRNTQSLSLNVLKEFRNPLHFSDLNKNLLEDYAAFLREVKGYAVTTAWTRLKDLRTYLNKAIKEDGIKSPYPFDEYTIERGQGNRSSLTIDELVSLHKLYNKQELPLLEEQSLQRFLFACYTGLRISDIERITLEMVVNGTLKFEPKKNAKKKGKKLSIPLPDFALQIIRDLRKKKGLLFPATEIHQNTVNKLLKVVGAKAGVKTNMSMHTGRYTFGTTFIYLGGDINNLQELFGHADIRTTAIYLKMLETQKKEQMSNLNKLSVMSQEKEE